MKVREMVIKVSMPCEAWPCPKDAVGFFRQKGETGPVGMRLCHDHERGEQVLRYVRERRKPGSGRPRECA